MWGLHGGIFYIGIRQWVYGQPGPMDIKQIVTDRVQSYMLSVPAIFNDGVTILPAGRH
jgi:hypothetical protein